MLYLCNKGSVLTISENTLHILDTDCMEISTIAREELVAQLRHGGIVENLGVVATGALVVIPNKRYFYNVAGVIQTSDKSIQLSIPFGNRSILVINNIQYEISFRRNQIDYYRFSNPCILINKLCIGGFDLTPAENLTTGVAYMYKLREYLIVVYVLSTLARQYYTHIIFTLTGELIGVVPEDKNIGEVVKTSVNDDFITKFIALGRNKGVY